MKITDNISELNGDYTSYAKRNFCHVRRFKKAPPIIEIPELMLHFFSAFFG